MNRRGFMSALAQVPIIGAVAGMVDSPAAIEVSDWVAMPPDTPYPEVAHGLAPPAPRVTPAQYRRLFAFDRTVRAELESLAYERHQHVSRIDPDLAIKRSFSPMAKIAFQRQRNVAREIEEEYSMEPWWRRKNDFLESIARRVVGL